MGNSEARSKQLPIGPHEQEDSAVRTRSKRARAAKQAQTQYDTVKGQAHAQYDTVKGRVKPAVESAASTARDGGVLLAERVGPTVRAARENVGPAAESAYETAKEKVGPVVADARDRVVDDLLPKLAEAIAAASAAAILARDNAVESAQETATAAVKNLPSNRRKRRRRRVLFLAMAIAAVGGAAAAFKARSKQEDPWTPGVSAGSVNGTTRLTPTPVPTPTPAPVLADEPVATGDPLTDPHADDPSVEESSTSAEER
jgi:hypothetical protein